MIVRWADFPPEARAAVEPLLRAYLFLAPGWCRQLAVMFDADGEGDAASSADPEYRQAQIWIHSGWLTSDPTQRRLEIIHELLHIPLAPMVDEHREAIDRLLEDGDAPKFKATLQEQWRKAFEGSVQDLSFALLAIPLSALPKRDVTMIAAGHPQQEAA